MNKFRSIKYKLFRGIILSFIIFLIIDIFYVYTKTQNELESELYDLNTYVAKTVEKQISRDFFNYNYTKVKYVLDSYINRMIEDIIILNKDSYIFAQKNKDGIEFKKLENFEKIKDNSNKFEYVYEMKLSNKTTGFIVVKNNQKLYLKDFKKDLEQIVILIFSMIIVLVIVLYSFNKIVIRPIKILTEDINKKELDESLEMNYKNNDEIGYLSTIFEKNHNRVIDLNKDINKELENIKSMNMTIKKQETLLSEQSKMAAMGEMIGNIAHQWRQPLSLISTASTGAKLQKEMDCLSDEQLNKALTAINDSAQYLSTTIDDFRSFFNPKDDREKEFYISNTISKTFHLINAQFTSKEIDIIQNIENYRLISIENELVQVLINILNNARDALLTKEGQKRLIFINTYQKDKVSYIKILDNAGGIEKSIINRIFEPYFTTKHQSLGTGIGLYMSKEIIHKHLNGNLSVSNEKYTYEGVEYTGASFTIGISLD